MPFPSGPRACREEAGEGGRERGERDKEGEREDGRERERDRKREGGWCAEGSWQEGLPRIYLCSPVQITLPP